MKNFWNLFLLTSLSMALISCSHVVEKPKPSRTEKIGNLDKVFVYEDIYISEQPNEETITLLKDKGFTTVINVRELHENPGFEEKKLVESTGMKYYQVPIKKESDVTGKWVNSIHDIIQTHKGEKILLHCEEGDRAGTWIGAHLYKNKKMSPKQSEDAMKNFDLVNPYWIKSLRKYIESESNY